MKNKILRNLTIFSILLIVVSFILPEDLFAGRRGGSFGGSRGGSSRSFGGSRAKSTPAKSSYSTPSRKSGSSFGGTRMTTASARQKYGTPRKVDSYQRKDANGRNTNYQINDYGGYSSGLMRGYMMGHITSSMMWTPWHGAFWYSRPVYVTNPDGSVGVYPPSFDWTKLFIVLFVVGAIVYIVYVVKRSRNRNSSSSSSFS